MRFIKDLLFNNERLSLSRVVFLSLFLVVFKSLLFNEKILNDDLIGTIFTVITGYVFLSKTKINGGK